MWGNAALPGLRPASQTSLPLANSANTTHSASIAGGRRGIAGTAPRQAKRVCCANSPPQRAAPAGCRGAKRKGHLSVSFLSGPFLAWDSRSVSIANTRKRVVARVSRREGVYNRAGEPSVPFCGKGGARERADGFFFAKGKKEAGAKRTLLRRGRGGQFRSPIPWGRLISRIILKAFTPYFQ